MALCEIERFVIGHINLLIGKGQSAVPGGAAADTLRGYTITECSLTKELLKPNEFTFTLRRDKIDPSPQMKSLTIVKSLLGFNVDLKVNSIDNGNSTSVTFIGTIGKVSVQGLNVTCTAYSPDADLQGSPKCRCFTNKRLDEIVDAVVPASISKKINIHAYVQPLVFPYIVQYNESDYDFLVRLAKRFGAFMYYDMTEFVFGKPKDVNIDASKNRYSVSYELQTGDPEHRFAGYNYVGDRDLDSQGGSFGSFHPDKLVEMAANKSSDFVSDSIYRADDPTSLSEEQDNQDALSYVGTSSNLSELVTCKFVSYHFGIDVGHRVTINENNPLLVTSVHLTWDCNGSPKNEVEAIALHHDTVAADDVFAPYFDFNAYPKSSAQRAVVVNNVDPKKMGRVRVKFAWQMKHAKADEDDYPWIRIAQPYGGKDKGCYILPEIGEEVMVGFEHENMEKPFVIGTLYHSSDDDQKKQLPENTWCEVKDPNAPNNNVNVGNEVKAFRTKKGHTIEFHDVDGGSNYGYIRIYGNEKKDGPNYDIILSTDPIQVPNAQNNGKEDYKIKGPKTKNIAAGDDIEEDDYSVRNLRLMVRSNGGDIVLDAGKGDIIMNAKNIRVHATGDVTSLIDQKNIMKVKDGQFVDVGTNSLVSQGKQNIVVKAEETESYSKKVIMNLEQPFVMQGVGQQNFQLSIDAKSLTAETTEKTEIKAAQSALIKASTGLDLQGGNKADLKATNVTIDGDAGTTVKGTDLTLDGKNSISERAAKVELTSPSSISLKSTKIDLTSPDGSLAGVWKLP